MSKRKGVAGSSIAGAVERRTDMATDVRCGKDSEHMLENNSEDQPITGKDLENFVEAVDAVGSETAAGMPDDAEATGNAPSLEDVSDTEPGTAATLQGFKRASIVIKVDRESGKNSRGGFQAHAQRNIYQADDKAICTEGHTHSPPAVGCTCGFYALKNRDEIAELRFQGAGYRLQGGSSAILTVELYGSEVLEGKAGYRAARQRVTHVELGGNCRRCLAPAQVAVRGEQCTSGLEGDLYWIDSYCYECADNTEKSENARFTLAELATLLGIDTQFGEAQHFSARMRKIARELNTNSNVPGTLQGSHALYRSTASAGMLLLFILITSVVWGGDPVRSAGGMAVVFSAAFLLTVGVGAWFMKRRGGASTSRVANIVHIATLLGLVVLVSVYAGYLGRGSTSEEITGATVQAAWSSGDGATVLYNVANVLVEELSSTSEEITTVAQLQTLVDGRQLPVTFVEGPVTRSGDVGIAFGDGKYSARIQIGLAAVQGEGGCAWRQLLIREGYYDPYGGYGGDGTSNSDSCDPAPIAAMIGGYLEPDNSSSSSATEIRVVDTNSESSN